MRGPGRGGRRVGAWVAGLLTISSAAFAQAPDALQLRVRYGAAVRSGSQQDAANPNLSYSGVTPNDLALNAWGWFLLNAKIGAALSAQREAFSLYDGATRITGGGLIRASIGPAGRLILGPVKLELVVGYGYSQLPTFGATANPTFKYGNRHAVLLAARGIVDVGPVSVEAKGEVPITVAATDGARQPAGAFGYSVGGALRLQLFSTGSLRWGLLADVTYVSDELTGANNLKATQSMIRAGGAIDLKWQEPEASVSSDGERFGEVEVTVVDADTRAPLPGATVVIGERSVTADAAGVAKLGALLPGALAAKASAGGYVAAEAVGTVSAGTVSPIAIALKKEGPTVGAVALKVIAREGKKPVPNAKVKLGAQSAVTDAKGTARFEGLPPGPVGVSVTAEGFTPGEEAASVVAGQTAEVEVALVEVKKRVPATINGLVRSTAGGKPIAADLEIPQLKIKTKADAKGAFSVKLDGGTYTVNISAPGYRSQTKSVTVKDGDQAIFNVDLHPK